MDEEDIIKKTMAIGSKKTGEIVIIEMSGTEKLIEQINTKLNEFKKEIDNKIYDEGE